MLWVDAHRLLTLIYHLQNGDNNYSRKEIQRMKKLFMICFYIFLIISLAGCGKETVANDFTRTEEVSEDQQSVGETIASTETEDERNWLASSEIVSEENQEDAFVKILDDYVKTR